MSAGLNCTSWLARSGPALLIGLALFAQMPLARSAPALGLAAEFENANRLYAQRRFADAAAAYQKPISAGTSSAALYFNLGNAWFKAGQIGQAIAAYRRAEQITPRDPDLQANLRFARNQTQGPTAPPGPGQRWLRRLTLNEWTLLACAAIWILLLLLVAGQLRPALRRPFRRPLWGLAFVALAFCSCLALAVQQAHDPPAIVIVPEVQARQSPLDEAQAAFTLHDGAELKALDEKGGWLEVSPGPGRIGWVRRDQILRSF